MMVVYINLDKPLTSQVLINGHIHQVEFESLPVVCFGYGRYGHLKEGCPKSFIDLNQMEMEETTVVQRRIGETLTEETTAYRL